MKLSKTILAVLATAVVSCGLFSASTQAVPITGGISFAGGYTPENNGGMAVSDLTLATQILFNTPASVLGANGTFTGATSVVFNQTLLHFLAPVNTPLTPFYTANSPTSVAFNLSTIAVTGTTTANLLTLSGTGYFSAAGFTDTVASFFASFNTAAGTFSFSASSGSIPDGGSALALLGLSLVVLEVVRRKFAVA